MKETLRETIYRPGSHAFFEMFELARALYEQGMISVDWEDAELLETNIGDVVKTAKGNIALDVPFEEQLDEAEYQGRDVELNKPKRGGSRKFYVYVKNPKTGKIKKVSFGGITGLSVKANDPARVRSFVARHDCKNKNDKTKPSYWSCRLPRYKNLGIKGGQWW